MAVDFRKQSDRKTAIKRDRDRENERGDERSGKRGGHTEDGGRG